MFSLNSSQILLTNFIPLQCESLYLINHKYTYFNEELYKYHIVQYVLMNQNQHYKGSMILIFSQINTTQILKIIH